MSTPSKTDTARKRFVGAGRAQKDKENQVIASIEDVATSLVPSIATLPQKKVPVVANQVPDDILNDEALNEAIKLLPKNYNMEIHKTIWQIRKNGSTRVALQFPEGLLMYSLTICDIVERFTGVETVVMGDVTYGACCVDDFTARALGCDFMVHYGHSCLVPVTITSIKTLYVFVEIGIDTTHFVETVRANFPLNDSSAVPLILVATIQFISALQAAKRELEACGYINVTVPQARPLSGGEILGCTSPQLAVGNQVSEKDSAAAPALIYLGDGRFHLESAMIANPSLRAFRYDPYSKLFTREYYDHVRMRQLRGDAIDRLQSVVSADTRSDSDVIETKKPLVAVVVGTLGRQGSPKVVANLRGMVPRQNADVVTVLLSEIFADKLARIGGAPGARKVEAWIQTSCPRLSIDWGHSFGVPLLSPYEAAVAFGKTDAKWRRRRRQGGNEEDDEVNKENEEVYPMDFYARASRGPWTPNYVAGALEKEKREGRHN